MTDTSALSLRPVTAGARLRHPSTLILLGANLPPLAGVLFWGWDAYVLLVLYWFETAIIGFWTIVRVATAPRGSFGDLESSDGRKTNSPIALTLFFIVHAGMFMAGHFLFLWLLFSGEWRNKVHGSADFIAKLVIGTGLWLPLLVLFLARGAVFFYEMLGDRLLAWLYPDRRCAVVPPPAPTPNQGGTLLGMFYLRIMAMHVAIIFGGFLSFLGSAGPLVILIALKTVIDLSMHIALDFGPDGKLKAAR